METIAFGEERPSQDRGAYKRTCDYVFGAECSKTRRNENSSRRLCISTKVIRVRDISPFRRKPHSDSGSDAQTRKNDATVVDCIGAPANRRCGFLLRKCPREAGR